MAFWAREQGRPRGSTGRDRERVTGMATYRYLTSSLEKASGCSLPLAHCFFLLFGWQKKKPKPLPKSNHILLIMKKNGSLMTEPQLPVPRCAMSRSSQETYTWLNWTLTSKILEQGLLWGFIQYNCGLFFIASHLFSLILTGPESTLAQPSLLSAVRGELFIDWPSWGTCHIKTLLSSGVLLAPSFLSPSWIFMVAKLDIVWISTEF